MTVHNRRSAFLLILNFSQEGTINAMAKNGVENNSINVMNVMSSWIFMLKQAMHGQGYLPNLVSCHCQDEVVSSFDDDAVFTGLENHGDSFAADMVAPEFGRLFVELSAVEP